MVRVREIVDDELFEWMRAIRRRIHEWPELAFQEHKTSELVAEHLGSIGVHCLKGIALTGVVGRLVVDPEAPTVALRADMDALPVVENTGLPFASKNPGIMHACGHDGHVAIVLGAARILKRNPPRGNVVFIFQPGEEGKGGARPMIEEGALEGVDVIFGCHLERYYQAGKIGIKRGIHTSYTDAFDIDITGRGGHAAKPHESVDAILIASQLVTYLQTIVSRQLDPLHPSVITIGVLNAGTVYNAIAEKAILKGTIRTTEAAVRKQIVDKIKGMAFSLSNMHEAKIDVDITPGYPPVFNHERECEFAQAVGIDLLGRNNVISIPLPSLGGEDFAYYTQKIPGCLVRLGAAKEGYEQIAAHSPRYDFDEEALRTGAAYLSELVRYTADRLADSEEA